MSEHWHWVDILIALPLLFWFYQGFKKGLVLEVFGLLGVAIGLLLALKAGGMAIAYLQDFVQRFPLGAFLVYALLFLLTFWLVLLAGKLIQRFLKAARLDFLNQMAGGLVATLKGVLLLSLLLWLCNRFELFPPSVAEQSALMAYLEPVGPWFYQQVGDWIPMFENIIGELESVIDKLLKKVE